MYPISSAARALFDEEQRQCIRITGIDRNGADISITDADVIEGSFTIDRYVCNSDRLEIGTAVAAELNFKLQNADGRFSSLIFEGTELFVEIGIADWASSSPSVTWMPCGYFTPDEQPRSLSVITVSALDRMMRFENYMIPDGRWTNEGNVVVTDENGNEFIFQTPLTLPNTVSGIVSKICELCGVPLGDSISTYPNASLAVVSLPEEVENITFRTFIQWAAGVMGTNAFIDWSGNLRFAWYATTDYISTVAERYQSDLQENDITVTGIRYAASETDIHVAGTDEYALDITGNGFVNTNVDAVLADIWSSRGGFTYRPFTASVVNAPYLFPMDAVAFTDKDGVSHASMLTNVNFGVNGATAIAAKGQSKLNASYPTQSPFTFRQEQSLENIKRLTTDEITAAVENATEHITGASDSHVRFIYDNNGGLQEIVVMNTDDIDTATKVWRWNSGGLGYSNTGYEGTYGLALTQDGAIVADRITTGTLNAGLIKAGVLSDYAGLNTWNMATGHMQMTNLSWTANNSSMDSTGRLTIGSAAITNAISGVDGGDGLLMGRSQMMYMEDGDVLFSISMPAVAASGLTIDGYYDAAGVYHSGQVDPIVEEITDTSLSLLTAGYLEDAANIYVNEDYALSIGNQSVPAIKITTAGNICLNGMIYVITGGEAFEGYNGYVLTAGGTLVVMNGIIVGIE